MNRQARTPSLHMVIGTSHHISRLFLLLISVCIVLMVGCTRAKPIEAKATGGEIPDSIDGCFSLFGLSRDCVAISSVDSGYYTGDIKVATSVGSLYISRRFGEINMLVDKDSSLTLHADTVRQNIQSLTGMDKWWKYNSTTLYLRDDAYIYFCASSLDLLDKVGTDRYRFVRYRNVIRPVCRPRIARHEAIELAKNIYLELIHRDGTFLKRVGIVQVLDVAVPTMKWMNEGKSDHLKRLHPGLYVSFQVYGSDVIQPVIVDMYTGENWSSLPSQVFDK